VPAPVGNPGYK